MFTLYTVLSRALNSVDSSPGPSAAEGDTLSLTCTPELEATVVEEDTDTDWDQDLHAGFPCPFLWVFMAFI